MVGPFDFPQTPKPRPGLWSTPQVSVLRLGDPPLRSPEHRLWGRHLSAPSLQGLVFCSLSCAVEGSTCTLARAGPGRPGVLAIWDTTYPGSGVSEPQELSLSPHSLVRVGTQSHSRTQSLCQGRGAEHHQGVRDRVPRVSPPCLPPGAERRLHYSLGWG